jgi:hypothetical protein
VHCSGSGEGCGDITQVVGCEDPGLYPLQHLCSRLSDLFKSCRQSLQVLLGCALLLHPIVEQFAWLFSEHIGQG